jgi:hypothetical protein
MPISPRAGLEGSGWRSAVTVNPQRSYSRGAGVGLGHPQVDGAGTLLPGPAGDRVDDRLTDAAALGLRPDEHTDQLDHLGRRQVPAAQAGRADLGQERDERAVAAGPLAPLVLAEGSLPGVGRGEGVRRVEQRLQADLTQRLPVGHRRRTYQDHASSSLRSCPPLNLFSGLAPQPSL